QSSRLQNCGWGPPLLAEFCRVPAGALQATRGMALSLLVDRICSTTQALPEANDADLGGAQDMSHPLSQRSCGETRISCLNRRDEVTACQLRLPSHRADRL